MSNLAAYEFLTRLQKELGAKFLPLNFKNVLKKKLNRFMKDVEVERVKFMVNFYYSFCLRFNLNLQEAGGKESEYYSALAFLKKIDEQALRLIRNRQCKNPMLSLGLDGGGDRKLVATLFLHDLDNPKADKQHYKDGGWRKSLLLAEGDYCPEVI